MNTEKQYLYIFWLCLICSNATLAQSTYRVGGLPAVNLNAKLKNNWSLNAKTESRQLFQQGTFWGDRDKSYEYVLTDYSLIFARKIGLNSRISGGYLFRFLEGMAVHRFIQQYTITQKLTCFRLAHRVVTDQTFSPAEAPEYRLRYRLASEIPLNGQSADPSELYIKIGNEYLNSIQNADYDLEIRLVPMLGYALKKNHKLEVGLDYRVNSFLNQYARHSFWTVLNWYIEI